MQAFLANAFENGSLPAALFADLETALEKQRITVQDMQVYDRDAWTDLWEGLVEDGVNLNPGDKQCLRLAAGPPVGMFIARIGMLAYALSLQSAARDTTMRKSPGHIEYTICKTCLCRSSISATAYTAIFSTSALTRCCCCCCTLTRGDNKSLT